jgi:hypothetical protein
MKNTQSKIIAISAVLAALMAATRFNHFGSAFSLPDASLAVFFLGGLYLARNAWASMIAFIALTLEAGLIDYYAISVQGVSDWCMTPAYWFLVPAYGSLWLAGRWFVHHYAMAGSGLAKLALTAWAASSFAFMLSNLAFYLLSEYFAGMSGFEYVSRVSQYYIPYVSAAVLYVACCVGIHMVLAIGKRRASTQGDMV